MSRTLIGATLVAFTLLGAAMPQAEATDRSSCTCRTHHRHVVRRAPPTVVYGRHMRRAPAVVYNHEDNGQYDQDQEPPRSMPRGQAFSWLDGYGTRPVVYGADGTYNVYGGSSQVMPFGIPPAGGLSVYEPGAYGPGPTIIRIPPN